MTRHLNISLALLLATLLAGETQGEILLFQRMISVNRSVNIFDTDQFDLDLIFGDDFFVPTNDVTLFDSLVILPGNVGTTYDATPISDSAFSTVAERLTDAINEFIKVSLTEDQLDGRTEQRGWAENFFFGHSSPPDLAGTTVERVSLHIDDFDFSPDAFDLKFTVMIYGVPEPAAAWLLLVGLMVLGLTPFCRRQQASRAPVV
ncbi:MAG: hypothetical protein IH831_05080 [Planctomycetes bacterium]|nr:hypothetical protein [Planctomycetota bacterium]